MSEQQTPQVVTLADLIKDISERAQNVADSRITGKPLGVVSGLGELDEMLGGFFAPGLHIVQSAPGAGKSAVCLQIAAECQTAALYVSAEMNLLEMFYRLIALKTQTFIKKLKNGETNGAEMFKKATATAQGVPNLSLMDASKFFASRDCIEKAADSWRSHLETNHLVIVLDSLQVWARSAKGIEGVGESSEYDLINTAIESLSKIASRLDCPIICISHRNREGNKGQGGLHAGKGSGDLEYVAESVIELTPNTKKDESLTDARGFYYTPVNIAIHKNRHGENNRSFNANFYKCFQQFRAT